MKQYLTWLPLAVVSITLITGLAIAKNKVELNTIEIEKIKDKTDGIDVIQLEQRHANVEIKDIKNDVREILKLLRK